MSDFVRIAFNLDRVAGGRHAGRNLTLTNGVELLKTELGETVIDVDGFELVPEGDILVHRPVKRQVVVAHPRESVVIKEGFSEIRDARGAIMGYARAEDGLPLPTAADFEAMRAEVKTMPDRLDPRDQRLKDLEDQISALRAQPAAPARP